MTGNIVIVFCDFGERNLQTLVGRIYGQCLVCFRTCVYQVLTGLTSSPITGMLCFSSGIYLTVKQCVVTLVSLFELDIFGCTLITSVYIPVTEDVRGGCQDTAH